MNMSRMNSSVRKIFVTLGIAAFFSAGAMLPIADEATAQISHGKQKQVEPGSGQADTAEKPRVDTTIVDPPADPEALKPKPEKKYTNANEQHMMEDLYKARGETPAGNSAR